MKEKYIYVVFNNNSAKYLYLHPPFKIRKGYFVELETANTISQGYVYKVVKFNESDLPYPKERLRNITSIIDKNIKTNLKTLKPNSNYIIKKKRREILGWKKVTKKKDFIKFDYKNQATISTFYDKFDGIIFISCQINNFISFETYAYSNIEQYYKIYNIKKTLKNWCDGKADEDDIYHLINRI